MIGKPLRFLIVLSLRTVLVVPTNNFWGAIGCSDRLRYRFGTLIDRAGLWDLCERADPNKSTFIKIRKLLYLEFKNSFNNIFPEHKTITWCFFLILSHFKVKMYILNKNYLFEN